MMEAVVSAVAGDLISRFISFLLSKHSDVASSEKQAEERLQQLLLRVHTVVEEADGRYITNSGMLLQLKMLASSMYHGYYALDTFRCNQVIMEGEEEAVTTTTSGSSSGSSSFASYLGTPLKRFRANSAGVSSSDHKSSGLQGALLKLETLASNMTEFMILLGGCERMSRRPYDAYLYVDNFMFSRRAEKQQVINFLLHHNPLGSPPVLPIVGDNLVGKKTLVAHVCNDDKVHGYFSSIFHFTGDNLCTIDNEMFSSTSSRRTLIVVKFVSEVDDEEWRNFYRAATRMMSTQSKIVILSRTESLARYGTVQPIHLSKLPDEEYSYLFKTLAFGSARTEDHPGLTLVAREFITLLGGSLLGAYSVANGLRSNLNLGFWLSMLNRYRIVTKKNLSMFGEPLSLRWRRRYPVDLTGFLPSPAAPLLLMPPRAEAEVSRRELPKVRISDLILDPTLRPKGDFDVVTWESRIPPYTEFSYHAPSCVQQQPKTTSRRKREATISL